KDFEETVVTVKDPVGGKCSLTGEVVLTGTPIKDKVLATYPQLTTNATGCATPDATNYTYMGGCYLKGAQTNNYIWYNGFLWRIMGINADGTVKMITEENVTVIPYNAANTNFEGSYADKWLNDYFYNNLDASKKVIANGNFCQGLAVTTAPSNTTCTGTTLSKKIGLLTIDEYNLAGMGGSYLNTIQVFWTMSPYDASNAWCVSDSGNSNATQLPTRTAFAQL
ncbi:MAG: hypothetical protein RSB71_03225, partial [Bacilli bacterium]